MHQGIIDKAADEWNGGLLVSLCLRTNHSYWANCDYSSVSFL